MTPGRWEPGSSPLPLSRVFARRQRCIPRPEFNTFYMEELHPLGSLCDPALLYHAQPANGPDALTWLSRSPNWALLSLIRESYFDLVHRRHWNSVRSLTSIMAFLGDAIWLSVNNTSWCS